MLFDVFRSSAPALLALLALACSEAVTPSPDSLPPRPVRDTPELAAARARMVEEQVKRIGVTSPRILEAMRRIPRHAFLPETLWDLAYADRAVRRPDGETVTAPDLTGAMLQALQLAEDARVLECGTRSGWLTAILARAAGEVFTVDARPESVERVRRLHARLGVTGVRYRVGDPLAGWPEEGPFDAVVVNGAVPHVPKDLYSSLRLGGAILAPVGDLGGDQTLLLIVRGDPAPASSRPVLSVRFGGLAR